MQDARRLRAQRLAAWLPGAWLPWVECQSAALQIGPSTHGVRTREVGRKCMLDEELDVESALGNHRRDEGMRVVKAPSVVKVAVAGLGLATLTYVSSCDPTDGRAERDLQVGKALAGGVRFSSRDGLAAVRRADVVGASGGDASAEGELVLWGGAPEPVIFANVSADATTTWTVELQNALRDIELTATDASGAALEVESLGAAVPTRPRFRISLPSGQRSVLRFTAPDSSSGEPFRFALLSDVQTAIDEVQDLFDEIDRDPSIVFVLGAGDLTQDGTAEELSRFRAELKNLEVPYFATLGNHELVASTVHWHDYFGRANFRFVFRGVQFTLIDSGSATIDPMVYDWLDGWLAEGQGRVHVVAMHIPPIDPIGVRNGSFASRNEGYKLLNRLAEGGVDLTLYGHIHSFYEFDNGGIPAFISGGGGALPERFDDIGRHFMALDIDADRGLIGSQVVQIE